jgi:hypothetical protein
MLKKKDEYLPEKPGIWTVRHWTIKIQVKLSANREAEASEVSSLIESVIKQSKLLDEYFQHVRIVEINSKMG